MRAQEKQASPPRWADSFLEWFCDEDLLEEIQGDLHEAFQHRLTQSGKLSAKTHYILDVLEFFKPYAFEKYSRSKQFVPMFQNYIKVAIRSIFRRKAFTLINLIGLTVGLASVLMISLYLNHELTYDQGIKDYESVYRMVRKYRDQTYTCMPFKDYYGSDAATQLRLTQHLNQYEEVALSCHFVPSQSDIGGNDQYFAEVGEKRFVIENILYTNTLDAFLAIFPQTFLLGNVENLKNKKNQLILTASQAERFFGKNWQQGLAIGTAVTIQDDMFEVGGVIENPPGNVHYDFNFILSQESIPSWGAYTYFKVTAGSSAKSVVKKFEQDADLVYPGYHEDVLEKGLEAVALPDVHFTQNMLYELKPVANKAYLRTFGLVGIIILLIIWTNYTNLSIAAYAGRQRELGVRKLMGARGKDISAQLMTEAVLLCLVCVPLVYVALSTVLPIFNEMMDLSFVMADLFSTRMILILLALVLTTGIFSGIYPAAVYSRKSMVKLFQAKLNGPGNMRLFNMRNVLLTGQFVMIVSLLSLTYFIHRQMDYVNDMDLGFQKEGIVYFGVNGVEKYNLLKPKLEALPEVKAVGSGGVPGSDMYNQLTYKMKDTDVTLTDGTLQEISYDSFEALGIVCEPCKALKAGKERIFLINQTAAEKLAKIKGVGTNELIGETLVSEPEWENEEYGYGIHHTIGGIIDDYKYFSLKYPNQSLLIDMTAQPSWAYEAIVQVETDDWLATMQQIQDKYEEIETAKPFDAHFLEDRLEQLYSSEKRAGFLMGALSAVAWIVALMGLVGLVSFITFSRQKEMGIRKVFGASVKDIMLLLNRDFAVLAVIATLISLPLAIYLTQNWLENFAYSISPSLWLVGLAGLLVLLVVALVVSLISRKAANSNPRDVLRYE